MTVPDGIKRLFSYLRRYWVRLFFGALCVLCSSASIQLVVWTTKTIIDSLVSRPEMDVFLRSILTLVGFALLGGFFTFLMRLIMVRTSRQIEYELRNDLLIHLMALPRSFYDKMRTGDIMSRSTEDLNSVRMLLGPAIMYSINTGATFCLALAMMIRLDPRLSLYSVTPLIFLTFMVKVGSKTLAERFKKGQESLSAITTDIQENLSGIRVIKSFCREEAEKEAFGRLCDDYVDRQMDIAKIWGWFFPLLWLTAGAEMVLVILIGGTGVVEGRMTIGSLAAFMGYLALLVWPMTALGWVINLYQRGVVSMARINELFEARPEIKDGRLTLEASTARGDIVFKGVSFSYNGGKKVLDNIDLTIPAGKTLGIVGRTGSGKTSLVQLVARLYDVDTGSVSVDGVDIKEYKLSSLLSNIGYVSQEPFIFSDTIGNNIGFGLKSAAETERDNLIRQASVEAELDSEIGGLEEGYAAILGERGINLSGGQKQRLTIARALIGDPRILVLDDCLSSVDADTEQRIRENIYKKTGGCTILLVAHRISTVQKADIIIYLENGRIAETGTHQELLALRGHYFDLYRRQLLEEELTSPPEPLE